jgi:tetratricopeptide (TPR) repeat protein
MADKKLLNKALLGICSGLLSLTIALPVTAAEDGENAKPEPPPSPPFIKAPVVNTKYTTNCKELGLQSEPKGEKRRTYALDPANFRRLEKANEAMGEENWEEALVQLKELEERALDSRKYDLAKAREYLGYVYLSMNDFDKAINSFKQVIDAKILPVKNEQSLIRNVAGLYLAIDPPQPDRAMGIIEAWFETAVKPKPRDYVLLAQAAVLGKMYDKAICPIRIAINNSDRPKSSWFDILVAAHFELEDFEGAAVIAKERLLSFPEEGKYWRQLSGLYNKLERMEDALIISELAHKQGFLTKGSEYKNLASMYAINELAFKAASILQEGLDKGIIEGDEKIWKQTGVNWQFSRENKKAIAAYAKAGDFAEHGLNELKIGQLLSEDEEWAEAAKYFRKAISKGGLKDSEEGRAHMQLGIALFNADQGDAAIKALQRAQDFKAVRRNASQWINYVRDAMAYANK